MEAGGNSKGWIRGGTGGTRGYYGSHAIHPLQSAVCGGLACTDPGADPRFLELFSHLNAASPGHALPWLLSTCIPRPGLPGSVLTCSTFRLVLEFGSCAS